MGNVVWCVSGGERDDPAGAELDGGDGRSHRAERQIHRRGAQEGSFFASLFATIYVIINMNCLSVCKMKQSAIVKNVTSFFGFGNESKSTDANEKR